MQRVTVLPYDPHWREQYERERTRILYALGGLLQTIEHIGSTSVEGLAAKPVIDMMPGVKSLEAFDSEGGVGRMQALGYTYVSRHEDIMPFRRYFTGGTTNPHHINGHAYHVHLVEIDSDFWRDHLLFRDYLRTHPAERDRYGAFKQQIAPLHSTTRTYYLAKDELIKDLLAAARMWAAQNKNH